MLSNLEAKMRKIIFVFLIFFQSYSMDYGEIDRFYRRVAQGADGELAYFGKLPKWFPETILNI